MQKEVTKLLKRLNVEKLKSNHKECIEINNIIGGLYSDVGSYEEAIHYHQEAFDLSKTIGDSLSLALASRFIGESKASLGQFSEAINYIKKYLDLAERLKNKVEIQRAWTTLGRVYLMQAQEMKDNNTVLNDSIKRTAYEAQKTFETALRLAESVRDQVEEKEYAQMNSSLLNNLALIDDICGRHNESVIKFNRAIEICKRAKLKEDLYRCQIILTSIYRKKGNIKMAVKTGEEALVTAKLIGKKILICDAYIECGLVKISQRDFKNAKRTFAQAYLERSPSEEDQAKAIKLTKLTHLISETYDKISQDSVASETRLKLCDKMGDLLVATEHYKLAIEYYRRAFSDAKVCQKPKSELARILYSVAETYADDGQFEHALLCYQKELTYRDGNDKEQCQSLIKIAHMQEYLNENFEKVCSAYEKAYQKANKDPKLMYNVLKDYIPYIKKSSLNHSRLQNLENVFLNLKSYQEVQNEIENEGDEEIDDLEDEIANIDDIISDDDDNDEVLMVGRRRARGTKKFKANEVGDTPLHEACIKGDFKRVKSLISQGHDINPRDNAGWIPLHEACNHGHYDIAEHLIKLGADVNNRGLKGMTPLHDAATNGHFDIMRLLIQNGANVIALTDTGETVLGCLRDYKKRNYDKLSNREVSEYKQIESELLNIMDKRGFNLMEANLKTLGSRNKNTAQVNNSSKQVPTTSFKPNTNLTLGYKNNQRNIDIAPKSRLNVLQSDLETSTSNTIKDYRNTIGSFKRKRKTVLDDDDDDNDDEVTKRTPCDLPAIFETEGNTSAPTKQWLIDDVSRSAQLNQTKLLNDLRSSALPEEWLLSDEDDDKNDDLNNSKLSSSHSPKLTTSNVDKRSPVRESSKDIDNMEEFLFTSDEDDIDNNNENKSATVITLTSPIKKGSPDARLSSENFSILNNPLIVTIEDKKLLIPIKDEKSTIKWLKQSVIDRYSILVGGCKPVISIAPVSDSTCYLYDEDLCKDIIRDNLIAHIESWQLDSIEQTYLDSCKKLNLEPLELILDEMRKIDDSGDKLDLSYCFIPKNHLKPISMALARRDFTDVKLTGCTVFSSYDYSDLQNQEILNTIGSWRKLNHLKLNCCGLVKNHFKILCDKMKFPDLRTLDLSFNSIAYKCKSEFAKQIESLLEVCPNLNRLDLRKNDLEFVPKAALSSIENFDSAASNSGSNIKSMLELNTGVGVELNIMGSHQNEYSVYSA